jgi:hypothetical protein
VQAQVGLEGASGYDPFGPSLQGKTDRNGRITLPTVPPGEFIVYASAAAAAGGSAKGEVAVRSGQQSEVQVTLHE